jgi:hypothetical protein
METDEIIYYNDCFKREYSNENTRSIHRLYLISFNVTTILVGPKNLRKLFNDYN